MIVDWTLNVGNLLTIGAILFAVAGFYYNSKALAGDMIELKNDMEKLTEVITKVAVQDVRIDNQGKLIAEQSARLNRLDARFDELRRGEGLITPPDQRR